MTVSQQTASHVQNIGKHINNITTVQLMMRDILNIERNFKLNKLSKYEFQPIHLKKNRLHGPTKMV